MRPPLLQSRYVLANAAGGEELLTGKPSRIVGGQDSGSSFQVRNASSTSVNGFG